MNEYDTPKITDNTGEAPASTGKVKDNTTATIAEIARDAGAETSDPETKSSGKTTPGTSLAPRGRSAVPRPSKITIPLLRYPVALNEEDPIEYAKHEKEIWNTIKPRDAIEHAFTRDYVVGNWRYNRYLRAEGAVIDLSRKEALIQILESILTEGEVNSHADRRAAAEAYAEDYFNTRTGEQRIDSIFSRHGISDHAIEAQAITLRGADVEQLGRLMMRAQKQRDEALKKIEQYRNDFLPLVAEKGSRDRTAFGDEV